MPSEIEKMVKTIDAEALQMYRGMYDLPEGPEREAFVKNRQSAITMVTNHLSRIIGVNNAEALISRMLDACWFLVICEQDLKRVTGYSVNHVAREGK